MAQDLRKDELPEVNQPSQELGISPSSVYRLIHAGELQVGRFGPVYGYRVKRSEVRRYMKKRESLDGNGSM